MKVFLVICIAFISLSAESLRIEADILAKHYLNILSELSHLIPTREHP